MTAPFVLILSYMLGGMPVGTSAELLRFEIDQRSLEACEQTKAKIQADFHGMTGGCQIKMPELIDPAAACLFVMEYPNDRDGCPHYWIMPATVHAP